MIAIAKKSQEAEAVEWQESFLEILPAIQACARAAFQSLHAEAKEDAVSEVVADAMCAYRRLHERGELQRAFASVLVKYAVARYRDGRRVGTPQRSGDVYSPRAKKAGGYELCSLGAPGEQVGPWIECLIDHRRTAVPEQVAFRLDFPRWLDRHTARDQRIAQWLSLGYSTTEVAEEFRISLARASQIRRELAESWREYMKTTSAESN